MSKRKTSPTPSRKGAKPRLGRPDRRQQEDHQESSSGQPGEHLILSPAALREIVETLVSALVLAFLFRTFEAEAFVIPTGSMAPTLMGRHKDLTCEQCGYPFQVSASDEVDPRSNRPDGDQVVACTCPMCRYPMSVGPNPHGKKYRSYKGDRILVGKFPYQFCEPERWDVAVFKYPGGAKTNFIKRIVGLPGETIRISHGDLFVKKKGKDRWTIARKPLAKIKAIMQPVYDNDYVQRQIVDGVWPARWGPQIAAASTASGWPPVKDENPPALAGYGIRSYPPARRYGWVTSEDYKSFRTDGTAPREVWLSYRHLVPSYDDWQQLNSGLPLSGDSMRPQLITDFNPYNTDVVAYGGYSTNDVPQPDPSKLGLHWVGDLAIECEMEVGSQRGEAIFELVEGGRHFQCRIDVATGRATLSIDGLPQFRPSGSTCICQPGAYRVFFANFDDQLFLSINGHEVSFDDPTTFGDLHNRQPMVDDLEPARIGSNGAELSIEHLKLFRDIYYIAARPGYADSSIDPITDFDRFPYHRPLSGQEVARVLSDPRRWSEFGSTHEVKFTLERFPQQPSEDRFLVLGDNSAESKDSRLWEYEGFDYFVKRELLIGKALFIYWPHSLDRIPGTQIPIRFFPNFWRMWFVR